jgi:beta-glucanase (GH16 family)
MFYDMKRSFLILLLFSFLIKDIAAQEHIRYALIWNDEFNSTTLDNEVWSKIRRGSAQWTLHMSSNERLYDLDGGDLVLRGMVNDFLPNDTAKYLTGGVWSKNRKMFGFGRIEIRAKFDEASGYWPAIWMLPQNNHALNWPYGGEIDIMEHFNTEKYVNQTVHSNYTYNLRKGNNPPHVTYQPYLEGEYNTYGVERFVDSLVFFVNGQRTFNYPRYRKGDDGQFPFSQHNYYLILDSQLGYSNGPAIDDSCLPVELRVDYVRYYEVDTRTDVIPEPLEFQTTCKKLKKVRRVVYDKETLFDNPDEYTLVVKCGKATIAGNRHWAENTLAQLKDENGYVSNLEIHDKAACLYRGVSLEKCAKRLTFEDIKQLLERMSFYKLNYLKWNAGSAFTTEQVNTLKEYANSLGIAVVSGNLVIPNVDIIELEANSSYSLANRVFLNDASSQGAWFMLNDIEDKDMDALMAFSERYWRGGNAGEVKEGEYMPEALSTAGSRLANFKDKLLTHRRRFYQK